MVFEIKEQARRARNMGMLLNVIKYNFGQESLDAFKRLSEVMDNPESWSQQMEAAWRVFERTITEHK